MSREDDLNAEINSHLQMSMRDHMERGASSNEAAMAAEHEMGNLPLIRETTREMWRWAWLDSLRGDVFYGARTMARNPGFTAIAVFALALGIGANSAIFSAVDGILLRPLAYRDPERLVVILLHGSAPVAPANFIDWKAQSQSFENMGAAELWTPDLTGTDQPMKVNGLHVTSDIFPVLGISPMLGRTFEKREDQVGNEYEVVLSHKLWQRQYGGDRGILGRLMQLDGKSYTIVGVMPAGFQFAPFWATKAELWAPLAFGQRASSRGGNSLRLFARLKPNVGIDQARAELAGITARLEQQYPGTNRDVEIVPLKEKVVGKIRPALLTLLSAVGFVLMIACSNVAHMLLARAAARAREVAVRVALGADRWRLIRQFLTESLMLAFAGGAFGLLFAYVCVRAMVRFGPPGTPRLDTLSLDWRVVVFTCAASLITGMAFGLAPAFQASRTGLGEALKEGGRGGDGASRNRLRSALVVTEFALSLMLLIGAGLMLRTFVALESIDPGFRPHNLLTMLVSVGGSKDIDRAQQPVFFQQVLERVRGVSGVESAGMTNHLPIAGDLWGSAFWIEGRPIPHPGEEPAAAFRLALPGYMETMGMTVVRGRAISTVDTASSQGVIVVNEYLARKYWPNEDPIGKRLTLNNPGGATPPQWLTVVGVVKNAVRSDWAAPAEEEFFLPYLQQARTPGRSMTLVIRTPGDPAVLASTIRSTIWDLDHNVTISELQTMDSVVELANAQPRFNMALLTVFASVAMVLSAVGIYGVMSYAVTRRRQEIGIRMALGARQFDVLWMMARQGMTLAIAGTTVGIAGALALSRLMTKLLFGVQPNDPATFAIVPLILIAVALAACLAPARRAARTSPMIALRQE